MVTAVSSVTERFAAEHFVLNSISKGRQEQSLAALARLETFLLGKPLEEATDDDLRQWLLSLLNSELKPSSVNYYLRAVTPFYRWCWQSRIIDAEHLMRINAVKAPRGSRPGKPRPYTRKELARLWAALDARWPRQYDPTPADIRRGTYLLTRWRKGTSPYRSVRPHVMHVMLEAMIELALVCGLRRTEIYHLSLDDVHPDNEYIAVHGKRVDQNPKERDVPYPESTRKVMKEWFRLRTDMGATGDSLWLSVTGSQPAAPLRWQRMEAILHTLGSWQLHRLRHTCATHRLREGMKLHELQRFLGHANISQTLAYAELERSDVHKGARRSEAGFQRAIGRTT